MSEVPGNLPRVLVIDDEPVIVEALRRVLAAEGFEVEVAEDAESALERLGAFRPSVTVVDLQLPGISGLEFLERIATRSDPVVGVLMSGFAGNELVVAGLQAGAFGYLPKPFTFEEARSVAVRALRFRRLSAADRLPATGPPTVSGLLGVQSWARVRDDGTALVGVTDVFLRTTGRPRSIILPTPDFPLIQGDALVRVVDEHGYPFVAWTAMGGQVIEVNARLEADPGLIADEPYGGGWVARLQPVDAEDDLSRLARPA